MDNDNNLREGSWIAVQVRSGCEHAVQSGLQQTGYEEFLPTAVVRQSRRGTVRRVRSALFPGYIFCRYIRYPRFRIVEIPGVIRLVGIGKTPLAIPETEIESIRRVVDSGVFAEPWDHIQTGQTVVVKNGPLKGLRGTFMRRSQTERLIVGVQLLGRAVAVEVNSNDVRPVKSPVSEPADLALSVR